MCNMEVQYESMDMLNVLTVPVSMQYLQVCFNLSHAQRDFLEIEPKQLCATWLYDSR